jgi:hypothetical protein
MLRVGRWEFPTKKAAERHISAILGRHAHHQRLTGDDDAFMRALIEIHPRRAVIVDCGLAYVFVQHLDEISWQRKRGTRRFCVKRTDSSIYDFSWRDALYPENKRRRVASVFRHIIHESKELVKSHLFHGVCEVCGRTIKLAECDLDHIPPQTFDRLMDGFLQSIGKTVEDLAIVVSRDYQTSSHLEDDLIADAWYEYHDENARLRPVCARCNLSAVKKQARAAAGTEGGSPDEPGP